MAIYSNRINVIASSRSIPSLRLMITNTQNVSAPAGLQVLATVPLTFGKYSVDFDKIAFYYNGNPVYSWVESVSNLNMNVWLKMPVSIPANTSITINAMPNIKTVFDNNYWGCAPTLTNQYGQYDNGTSVFSFYDNFVGTTLNTNKWVSGASGGTATINNGLSLIVPKTAGNYVYVASASAILNPPVIVEAYMNGNSINVSFYRLGFGLVPSQTYLQPDGGSSQDHISWQGTEKATTEIVGAVQTGTSYTIPTGVNPVDSNFHIWGIEWLSGEAGFWYNGYSNLATTTTNVPSDVHYLTLSYYAFSVLGGTPTPLEFQWVRTRAYPPNGVMPSVTVSY